MSDNSHISPITREYLRPYLITMIIPLFHNYVILFLPALPEPCPFIRLREAIDFLFNHLLDLPSDFLSITPPDPPHKYGRGALDAAEVLCADMGVAFGGGEVAVSEKFLDVSEVSTVPIYV